MEFSVKAKYVRISPLKMRRVAKQFKNMKVAKARAYLDMLPHKGAYFLAKLLKSAEANARFILGKDEIDTGSFIIKDIRVDKGPAMRRVKPRARGRADIIRKRMSHITLTIAGGN